MTVLLCPLCSQPRFNNLESLRVSLIKAATQSIPCPICGDTLMGLDKLTIHLFGHAIGESSDRSKCLESDFDCYSKNSLDTIPASDQTQNIGFDRCLADVTTSAGSRAQDYEKYEQSDCREIAVEDLGFLTALENPFKTYDTEKNVSLREQETITSFESPRENVELSEYMSDLLNKKMPIVNFIFTDGTPEKPESKDKPSELFENKSLTCSLCDCTFSNDYELLKHKEVAHLLAEARSNERSNISPKSDTLPKDDFLKDFVMPRYNCHMCSKSFKMKGNLSVHYRVAHFALRHTNLSSGTGSQTLAGERNFHCSMCQKSFKKEQHLMQHIKTHEGKQWRCETCNKQFTTKYFLKKHQRLHTGEMPYSCRTCNKTFTFQQSYHKHLLYHSDEKPHQCAQCGRAFKELSTLHNHQRIHSGEKPFSCETCGKCFRQRVSFIVHQRIHTGVLPYECSSCKKRFRYKVSLRSHKCAAQSPRSAMDGNFLC